MNARDWALLELDRRRLPGWKTGALPKAWRDRSPPSDPRDLAMAEHIVIGVVKNHLLLMHLGRACSGRASSQIDLLVQKILSIGLYQLRFMDRIPPSAAVDEAVEQCRRFGRVRAAGFVNAVLRNATRRPHVELPDRSTDPEGYAGVALSHPPDVFRRLLKIMSVEEALRFCEHDNAEPPTIVRLFPGTSVDQIASDGVRITPHERAGLVVVSPAKRATLESWARRGLAQVQDPTSAVAVQLMDIRPGQRLLDRCSGLGTKTLQMREYLGPDGSIVAIDPSEPRCEALRQLIATRVIANIDVRRASMVRQLVDIAPPAFDRILADVPCSNSGVLARRPEARYAQDDHSLRSLTALQREILNDTAPYLVPGGILVYSTCSVWPEENERQVEAFLGEHPEYRLVSAALTLPSSGPDPARYHDGGFVAVLRRECASPADSADSSQ